MFKQQRNKFWEYPQVNNTFKINWNKFEKHEYRNFLSLCIKIFIKFLVSLKRTVVCDMSILYSLFLVPNHRLEATQFRIKLFYFYSRCNELKNFLKPLDGMRFNVLDILAGTQSLLSSQYVSHKSSFSSNALRHGKSSLKRSANKLNLFLQLTFL